MQLEFLQERWDAYYSLELAEQASWYVQDWPTFERRELGCCGMPAIAVGFAIIHLNDKHQLTFSQIATELRKAFTPQELKQVPTPRKSGFNPFVSNKDGFWNCTARAGAESLRVREMLGNRVFDFVREEEGKKYAESFLKKVMEAI